jgi:prolyl-tRNA editing enzyme YbaK/EbsC (Cys-tRNA(Pro) deacylase)
MTIESVRTFLAQHAPGIGVVDLDRASETTWLSQSLGMLPAQIAKSLLLRVADRHVLLMACGDARVDNNKAKAVFNGKVRFVPAEEAAILTGHVPGGMCPFGLVSPLPVYCDVLLKRFDIVVTGGGATHSAVKIDPARLAAITGAEWVDVCEPPR